MAAHRRSPDHRPRGAGGPLVGAWAAGGRLGRPLNGYGVVVVIVRACEWAVWGKVRACVNMQWAICGELEKKRVRVCASPLSRLGPEKKSEVVVCVCACVHVCVCACVCVRAGRQAGGRACMRVCGQAGVRACTPR